jgi:hypothetical protein
MTDLFPQQAFPGDLLAPTRRHFLRDCSMGLGAMALASLSAEESPAGEGEAFEPLASRQPHFAPAVKNVIFLHMAGSPPHLDLFDYKPELVKHSGEPCPKDYLEGRRFAFTSGVPKLLGTPRKFKRYGEGGIWMSDALPKLSAMADDLTVIKSMHTEQFNHAPAQMMLYTGSPRMGRPSMGAWATYGLGSESRDLPGFIVLVSGGSNPSAGKTAWGSGFLPSVYQGVQCRSKGDPVLYLSDPPGMSRELRRSSLDTIRGLNEIQLGALGHPETRTRIAQYELVFKMQMSAPEAMDISRESKKIVEEYGAKPGAASFANNCLLARRLVERGVRFVQLFDWGWDFHGTNPREDIRGGLTRKCSGTDQAVAALLNDLKRRGLLESTLVVFSGEFGRTPFREGRTSGGKVLGRDHYPDCYSMFMAGGGLKSGISYGETDELGFRVAENPVHVHDLQATILHLLGFDHERLTFRFQGRDYRLTDVFGEVRHGLLA